MLSGSSGWTRTDGVDLDLTNVEKLTYKISIMVPSNSSKGAHEEVARVKNKGVLDIRLITVEELLDKRKTLLE